MGAIRTRSSCAILNARRVQISQGTARVNEVDGVIRVIPLLCGC